MGDPGVVAGLVGYGVAKLLDQAIKAVKQAKNFAKYRKNLEVLLQSIKPLLLEVEAGSLSSSSRSGSSHGQKSSRAVDDWLRQLEHLLQEAVELLEDCNFETRKNLNMITSYKMSRAILDLTVRIKELAADHAPFAILAKLTAMEVATQELWQQLSRLELSVTTREWCNNGGYMSEATAYSEIKSKTDNLTNALSSEENSKNWRIAWRRQSHGSGRSSWDGDSCADELQDLKLFRTRGGGTTTSKSLEMELGTSRHFGGSEADVAYAQDLEPVPDYVFGTEAAMKQLVGFLLSAENGSPWVGIWGKGGIGKTLLAQRVKNNPRIHNHFTGMTFWLTVGKEPSIERLQMKLCEKIGMQNAVAQSREEYKKKLCNALRGRKFLLVLDDVWEDEGKPVLEWMDFISKEELGCRILVTTRNLEVLERVHAADDATVRMEHLSADDSWKLFCQHAFGGTAKWPASKSFQKLVKEVVNECKGLPLALKVVGRALACQKLEEQWQRALDKLREAETLNHDHELLLYQRIQLSFDALMPIDPRLQKCFLYFAAFPEDDVVKVEYLVDLWAGEGILQANEYYDLLPDAYFLLGVLIGRSLIELSFQSNRYMRLQWVQIHDVLRDYALYAIQQKKEVYAYDCLFKAGKGLVSFPWSTDKILNSGDGRTTTSNRKPVLQATKISLIDNSLKTLPAKLRAPKLEVLLLRKNKPLKSVPPSFLEGFAELKVLDLSRTSIEMLPSSIGDLKHLVHLDLSSNTSLRKLPSSLKNLKNLAFLSVQGCSNVEPLTFEISYLKHLRSLNTGGCRTFWEEKVTRPVFRRTRSNLKVPVLSRQARNALESLFALKRLTDLRIESTKHEVLPSSISALTNLQVLKISFESLSSLPDELETSIAPQLHILDLSFCCALASLPSWTGLLTQLVTLDLRRCTGLNVLPDLQNLPRLQRLYLNDCKGITDLPPKFTTGGAFPALQELWMEDCKGLKEFPPVQRDAFPVLSELRLSGCDSLQQLPASLSTLPNLGHLDLSRCKGIRSLDNLFSDDLSSSVPFDLSKGQSDAGTEDDDLGSQTDEQNGTAKKANNEYRFSLFRFRRLEELKLRDVPLDHIPNQLASLALKRLDLGDRPGLLTPQLRQLQMLGVLEIT